MAIGRIDYLQLMRISQAYEPALPDVLPDDKVGQEDAAEPELGGIAQTQSVTSSSRGASECGTPHRSC